MKRRSKKAITSVLTAAALMALQIPAFPASAQNFLFITDIRLESGENAYDTLEEAGYSVMAVGLNAGVSEGSQVYLGYKTNTGAPITNILLSADVGDSFDTEQNMHYECAGHTDVDAGSGTTGCLYVTHDAAAGTPLVGLDILRANTGNGEELSAIPNDGAEIVRRSDGTPADLGVQR